MNNFKRGDIIGYSTMDGMSLLEIKDVTYLNANNQEEICLEVKIIRDSNLTKPLSSKTKYITLPQQRYEIMTKEEYFEGVQNEINKKQKILNELKEQYK